MRSFALVFALACAASSPAPGARTTTPVGEGEGAVVAPAAGHEGDAEATRGGDAEAIPELDPAPRPELRARWLQAAGLDGGTWLALENAGPAPVRLMSELLAGEASCRLAETPCVALVPGARLERACPALRGAREVRVRSCPPPGHAPHELRVATP
ncbi:MAG: hypothetical protein AAF447_01630 [Myxococcota bacterium]